MDDITETFYQACSDLPKEYLIKRPDLELLKAINAIEIMDARLDTGTSLSQASSDGVPLFDSCALYSPEDVCWIMDELLSLELSFYRGAPLCTSVYTSLLYHNPDILSPVPSLDPPAELASVVLRAFVLAYAKTIDVAYYELLRGHVLDGEDVWLDDCGLAVQLTDSVQDVIRNVDYALDWLDSFPHRWASQLHTRLQLRAGFLRLLSPLDATERYPYRDLARACAKLAVFNEPSPQAKATFDDKMISHLRHGAPPPPFLRLSHSAAFDELRDSLLDMEWIEALRNRPEAWMTTLKRAVWRGNKSPLLRSLCKTALDPPRGSTYAGHDRDILASAWLADQAPVPLNVLSRLDVLVESSADRRAFAIWRDLVGGYYLSTVFAPLANPSRRRRSYLSLSFAWHERAALADRFRHLPFFIDVARALHAARLDCLLEAALSGFDLDLVTSAEEREAWWWVASITEARASLGLPDTWEAQWAKAWLDVAIGLQALLTMHPPASESLPSPERFALRYKWARKIPTLPNGTKLESGLRPEYGHWTEAAARLDGMTASELQSRAVAALKRGLHKLDAGLAEAASITIHDLKEDVTSLIDVVEADGPVKWKTTRRKWIPRMDAL